jgi:hypothetical protein
MIKPAREVIFGVSLKMKKMQKKRLKSKQTE